jgi:hypothetical protein
MRRQWEPNWYAEHYARDMWAGRTAVVVGGGPSLRAFQWERLDAAAEHNDVMVVAVNAALFKLPHAHVAVTIDQTFAHRAIREHALRRTRFRLVYAGVRNAWIDRQPRIVVAPYLPYTVPGAWPHEMEAVAHGCNSGLAGLCVADQLGADPVYMLGYDLAVAADGESGCHDSQWLNGMMPDALRRQRLLLYREHFEAVRDKLRCTPLVVGPSELSERWARARLPRQALRKRPRQA